MKAMWWFIYGICTRSHSSPSHSLTMMKEEGRKEERASGERNKNSFCAKKKATQKNAQIKNDKWRVIWNVYERKLKMKERKFHCFVHTYYSMENNVFLPSLLAFYLKAENKIQKIFFYSRELQREIVRLFKFYLCSTIFTFFFTIMLLTKIKTQEEEKNFSNEKNLHSFMVDLCTHILYTIAKEF